MASLVAKYWSQCDQLSDMAVHIWLNIPTFLYENVLILTHYLCILIGRSIILYKLYWQKKLYSLFLTAFAVVECNKVNEK